VIENQVDEISSKPVSPTPSSNKKANRKATDQRKGLREFSCRRKFSNEESKKKNLETFERRSLKKAAFEQSRSFFFERLSWHVGLVLLAMIESCLVALM